MMIRVIVDFKPLTLKETKQLINRYWHDTHGECCGDNVPYELKERWFMENHVEHEKGCPVDLYMWEWIM